MEKPQWIPRKELLDPGIWERMDEAPPAPGAEFHQFQLGIGIHGKGGREMKQSIRSEQSQAGESRSRGEIGKNSRFLDAKALGEELPGLGGAKSGGKSWKKWLRMQMWE